MNAERDERSDRAPTHGWILAREYLYGEGEVTPSTHGRQRRTRASLGMNRETRTRSLLWLGSKPEHAAVSPNLTKEALLRHMPDKAHAKTQAELFDKLGLITNTTCKMPGERCSRQRQNGAL